MCQSIQRINTKNRWRLILIYNIWLISNYYGNKSKIVTFKWAEFWCTRWRAQIQIDTILSDLNILSFSFSPEQIINCHFNENFRNLDSSTAILDDFLKFFISTVSNLRWIDSIYSFITVFLTKHQRETTLQDNCSKLMSFKWNISWTN